MSPIPPISSTATLGPQALPALTSIYVDEPTISRISAPVKRIHTDADNAQWIQSQAHYLYSLFIQRIAEACVGKPTRLPTQASNASSEPVRKLLHLLFTLDAWTDEIEPQEKPQRFGNLAFRDWGAKLEAQVEQLHRDLLPKSLHPFITELSSYLLDSFGSFVRIDYGSGHEFCFAAWLCFLFRLGLFEAEPEAVLGLEVFPLYLKVAWRLQDRYGLEPAGSHGVWGLDDYQFLPYVFGAAQLRDQSSLRPAQAVTASADSTLLSSLPDCTSASLISAQPTIPSSFLAPSSRPPPLPNLYLTSLLRIRVLKKGHFHENSPLLHDISTSVPNWIKTYGGMIKMYEAECLNKRVVVQHFKFGGVGWVWQEGATVMPQQQKPQAALALGSAVGNTSSLGRPTARMTMPTKTTMAPPPMPASKLPASTSSRAAPTRMPTIRPTETRSAPMPITDQQVFSESRLGPTASDHLGQDH